MPLAPAYHANFGPNPNESFLAKQIRQDPVNHAEVVLKSLKDGSVVPFLDDGVAPIEGLGFVSKPGHSRILKNVRKRDHLGRPLWVGANGPLRVYDDARGGYIDVPAFDEKVHGAQLAESLAERSERADYGRVLMEQQKKKAQESANAAASVAVAQLANMLAGAMPAAQPAAAAKKGGAA
jgi:hypothetical protein